MVMSRHGSWSHARARPSCVLGLLFPGIAWRADVGFGIDGAAEYDRQRLPLVRGRGGRLPLPHDARAAPVEDRGQIQLRAGVLAAGRSSASSTADLNDVDQLFEASFRYHVSTADGVFGNDSVLLRQRAVQPNPKCSRIPSTAPIVDDERDRVLAERSVVLGARYQFTPRLSGTSVVEQRLLRHQPSTTARTPPTRRGQRSLQYRAHAEARARWRRAVRAPVLRRDGRHRRQPGARHYTVFGSVGLADQREDGSSPRGGPGGDPHRAGRSGRDGDPAAGALPERQFVHGPGRSLRPRAATRCPQGTPTSRRHDRANAGSCTCRGRVGTPTAGVRLRRELSAQRGARCDAGRGRRPDCGDRATTPIALTNADPTGEESTDVTVFATATLRPSTGPRPCARRSTYRRDQGNGASGLGGTARSRHRHASTHLATSRRNGSLALRGDWALRQSVDEAARVLTVAQSVDLVPRGRPFRRPDRGHRERCRRSRPADHSAKRRDEHRYQRWGLATRLAYRLTRNTSGYLQFTYNQQTSQSDSLGIPRTSKTTS